MGSWDEFQIVGELQEQNQNLLLQLDAKDRELREVQTYLSKIQVSLATFLSLSLPPLAFDRVADVPSRAPC